MTSGTARLLAGGSGAAHLHPVLVVGAGPVGLSAALALRAEGLPVTVLEAGSEGRGRPGSRAIFVHRESLLHLERARPGLGFAIAGHGLVWLTKRTFWRTRQVYERTYPPPGPAVLPHSTNLAQADTERLLLDAAKAAGVEFAWANEVVGVQSAPDEVAVTTKSGARWRARFVVAADGGQSAVRRLLHIALEGDQSENSFVIVDVAESDANPRRPERLFYYGHPAVGYRNVLLVPFAGGWRADLQCRPEDDPDEFSDPGGVRAWIAQVLPGSYSDRVTWVSTYRFLQVVADRFADAYRRVLLVGEAAHLFAPFGARGMNSGIADAIAAARAVKLALQQPGSRSGIAAIDQFSDQRRAAALYNRDAARQALAHLQARRLGTRAKRRTAALVAMAGGRSGEWLDAAPYGPRASDRRGPSGTY